MDSPRGRERTQTDTFALISRVVREGLSHRLARFCSFPATSPLSFETGKRVPRISEFYGIVIKLFYSDHQRPHLHAYYAEYRARFLIATGEVMDHGPFPVRGARLVRRWVALHRDELNANWERVRSSQPPVKIEPLP